MPRYFREQIGISVRIIITLSLILTGIVTNLNSNIVLASSSCPSSIATLTRVSSPIIYLDLSSSPQLTGMYEGIQVQNTSSTNYTDLWATASNFSGPEISLATNETGIYHIGALASGATTWVWFYLNAIGATSTPETHNINLYSTEPAYAGSPLCSQTFSLTATTDISASANKVNTVVAGPNPPQIGGIMTMTYSGATGTIGAANIFATTPATFANWPADVYRLKDISMTINGVTYNHTSYTTLETAGNYSVVATFVADGATVAPTSVSPYLIFPVVHR